MSTLSAKTGRNKWLAALLIASPLFWTVPTFLYLGAERNQNNKRCSDHLTALGKSLREYERAQGKLPAARNWIAAIDADAPLLKCPSDINKAHTASYAMNAALSEQNLSQIKDPQNVILLYESTSKASTPHGLGEDLVNVGKDKVGTGRHHTIGYRFNYYLMADGTVRAPENAQEVKTYRWVP